MIKFFQKIFRKGIGINISRWNKTEWGVDSLEDIKRLINNEKPTIFDVGANVGQSIQEFRNPFPLSTIHSFEPSPSTFEILKNNIEHLENISLYNIGVGSKVETLTFKENINSDMSSFLSLSQSGWGKVEKTTEVPVQTIDQIREENNIGTIDLLKIDTQGFDFEVLKGAKKTMHNGKIKLIFLELIFSDMYENLPSFGHMLDFLRQQNFSTVSIYPIIHINGMASYSNGLFVHNSILKK